MSKFSKKRGKVAPEVSTASLPDIIFMLLFFFMVVTVLRDAELKVDVVTPQATELTKLQEKSLVNHIYIGTPKDTKLGSKPRIQLGDKFATVDDIPLFLTKHKLKVPDNRENNITTSLKVDNDATMGIVEDVKVELRKNAQYRVNYSAKTSSKKKN